MMLPSLSLMFEHLKFILIMKYGNQKQADLSERNRISTMLKYESQLWTTGKKYIAGIDEAGRGPLAGPVVAAAVIFTQNIIIPGVNDSKKLSPARREMLYDLILEKALAIGLGICDEKVIDEINILQATYRAMKKAVASLSIQPDHVLVDGRLISDFDLPQTAIVRGDGKCFSIAAASIIAKVTRDRMMVEYDNHYPEYGFAQHKGYPTKKHVHAIIKHGLCPIHRTSFKIKNMESNG
jgi:ribonuclease HII